SSGYGDIATLHFIWEGIVTFYVIGYDEHGSEIGGYNDLMTQKRRSRILVTFGNDPDYGHVLYCPSWEKLKRCFDFTNGNRVILTNMLGNDLRVLVFGDDGYEINHENLPRIKVILDTTLKKETHKDLRMRHVCNWKGHYVFHEDEEVVFYETLSRLVNNEGSLTGSSHESRVPYVLSRSTVRRIPGKSLDEGLNTMEVVLGTGKGIVIEEVVEDAEVKEASETGNSGKQLLSVTENDVQTKTEPSTPPWSFES
ncbi:hypothetical protein Tco_0737261, partial [Tanacetum coccineum]